MRKNTWKKVAAGAMSLTMIAGQTVLPAGLGGLFTGGTAIVANAADLTVSGIKQGDTIQKDDVVKHGSRTRTIIKNGTTALFTAYSQYDDWTSDGDYTVTSVETSTEYYGFPPSGYDVTVYTIYVENTVVDLSTANVNLASDNSVASITVGEDTITDLTGFDITYGTDDSHDATAVPTYAGTYYAYVTAKNTNKDYTGTVKSAAFTVINLTTLTLVDLGGAVVVGEGGAMSAVEDTYTLKGGNTYTFYTNKTVYGADEDGSIASFSGQNQKYDGTTYKYKYTLTVPAIPAEGGYTLSHEHATQAHRS